MPVRAKIRTGGALALCLVSLVSAALGAGPRVHKITIDNLAFGPAPGGLHVNDIVEWRKFSATRQAQPMGASTSISRLAPTAERS